MGEIEILSLIAVLMTLTWGILNFVDLYLQYNGSNLIGFLREGFTVYPESGHREVTVPVCEPLKCGEIYPGYYDGSKCTYKVDFWRCYVNKLTFGVI